jgi:hypothetical protein
MPIVDTINPDASLLFSRRLIEGSLMCRSAALREHERRCKEHARIKVLICRRPGTTRRRSLRIADVRPLAVSVKRGHAGVCATDTARGFPFACGSATMLRHVHHGDDECRSAPGVQR